jgi:hypothetical protein
MINNSNILLVYRSLLKKQFFHKEIVENFKLHKDFIFDKLKICFSEEDPQSDITIFIEGVFACICELIKITPSSFRSFLNPLMESILAILNNDELTNAFPVCFKTFALLVSQS